MSGLRNDDGARDPTGDRPGPVAGPLQVIVLVVLLLSVFAALRGNDEPGLAVALYALIPILLAVFWFGLVGGLVAAGAALLAFLVDELLSPTEALAGSRLWWATVNRAAVFFGVAILVTLLLRRERALVVRLRAQQEELAELQSLRAALTPAEIPPPPHLQLATSFTPAGGLVAGDFYLVSEGAGNGATIVVGDVVGHGLEAARCAAYVRAALSTFAGFTSDPVQLLQLANGALGERGGGAGQLVTAICLTIGPPPCQEIRWAAAGHDIPWYLDTGVPLLGGRVGTPLGIGREELRLEAGHARLEPGAGVLLYTDGLTEGRSARRSSGRPLELFGEDRARKVVRDRRGAPPDDVLEALVSAVTSLAGGQLADDLCLVAFRTLPGPLVS